MNAIEILYLASQALLWVSALIILARATAEQLLDVESYAERVLAAPGRPESHPQEVGP